MGALSIWHWLVVGALVLVLFGGRGKVSALMGDLGKGLKAFKNNIKDDQPDDASATDQANAQVSHQAESNVSAEEKEKTTTEK